MVIEVRDRTIAPPKIEPENRVRADTHRLKGQIDQLIETSQEPKLEVKTYTELLARYGLDDRFVALLAENNSEGILRLTFKKGRIDLVNNTTGRGIFIDPSINSPYTQYLRQNYTSYDYVSRIQKEAFRYSQNLKKTISENDPFYSNLCINEDLENSNAIINFLQKGPIFLRYGKRAPVTA